MNNFDVYLRELKGLPTGDCAYNQNLLLEIAPILEQLEEILATQPMPIEENRVLWLEDKVSYYLKTCHDVDSLKLARCKFAEYCSYRDLLVSANLRLVVEIVEKKYNGLVEGVSIDDLIQAGNMGLMRAVSQFDLSKGTAFSTYATFKINSFIKAYINQMKYCVHIPKDVIYENVKKNKMDMSRELPVYMQPSLSLDELLAVDDASDENIYASSFLKDMVVDDTVDVFRDAVTNLSLTQLEEFLQRKLGAREFLLLKRYLGLGVEKMSILTIAKQYGLSKQRVDVIRQKSLKKLKRIPNILDIVID